MHNLTKKYSSLIKHGTMKKTEINSMRKALGYCSKLPSEEKQSILELTESKAIKLTPEHTEQCLNFLKRSAFKTNGQPRSTKDYPFNDHDLNVIRNFKEFRLVGLEERTNGFGETMCYESQWKTIAKNGDSFTYVCGHWGKIQIVSRGFKGGAA